MKLSEKYKILKLVEVEKVIYMNSGDEGIDNYWELVREGSLKNLVSFGHDWVFKLTDKGREYLEEIKKIIEGS